MKLTDEGEAFLIQARLAIAALDTAMDSMSANRGTPRGTVRISTSSWFVLEYVQPAIPSLLEQYPGLCVELNFDDRVVDMIQEGYDIVIRGGFIPDSAFIARPVCPLASVLVASPAYLAKHGIPRDYKDLQNHKLIGQRFLTGNFAVWQFETHDGSVINIDPTAQASLILSSPASLVNAALDGLGIAQTGVLPAWEHLCRGDLKIVIHHQHISDKYKMVMQYPHRTRLANRVKVTLDHLAEAFASNPRLHIPIDQLQHFAV